MINSVESEALLVVKNIELSFGDLPYPGDDDIIPLGSSGPEHLMVRDAFKGRNWVDVSKDEDLISFYYDGLLFFTPTAFRFYLPSYMVASIRLEDEMVRRTLLQVLSPPPHGIMHRNSYVIRIGMMDKDQIYSIGILIRFLHRSGYLDKDAISSLNLERYVDELN